MQPSKMHGIVTNLVQSRCGGRVERCHAIPHATSYNNAAHSWGVAMLMYYLWPADFPRLAAVCLSHDLPEAWVGDVPAPTMNFVPGLRQQLGWIEDNLSERMGLPRLDALPKDDLEKLKTCDRLELYLWCREQMLMGNRFAEETLKELEYYFTNLIQLPAPADEFLAYIQGSELLPVQAGVMREACK